MGACMRMVEGEVVRLDYGTHAALISRASGTRYVRQAFRADVLLGDWGYFCTPALSEVLRLPRVTVSNIPVLDPLTTTWDRSTGRRMHVPNMLAYTPQAGRALQLMPLLT